MPDLREALNKAYDEHEAEEEEKTTTPEPETSGAEGSSPDAASDGDGGGQEITSETGGDSPDTPFEGASEPGEKETKFLPPKEEKPAEETAGDGTDKPGTDESGEPASTLEERVPVAWKAEARQHWEKLPQEVRLEVIRRERETDQVLRESANARNFAGQFMEVVRPFETFMAADGVNPLQAVQNLMRTAATLRVGSPQQRADAVAHIIRQYGVDIDTLGQSIDAGASVPPAPGGNGSIPPELDHYLSQKLAPVTNFMNGLHQTQQEQTARTQADIDAEIDSFAADPANLFFANVQEDMADLIETRKRRGLNMSLQEAYDTAVRMNPELSKIQAQRQAAAEATKKQAEIERKKRAATSVRGVPASTAKPEAKDLRGAIEASWNLHSGEA